VVQLIRPLATTHSCDTQQRLVDLPFIVSGMCELQVSITDQPNLAPPGWWMLTIVDDQGIRSLPRWVHLSAE
jgi:hypothetical protein